MEVITSHTNADFDVLASMIAAKKLYPRSVLVFPGSLEKKLRETVENLPLPYKFEKVRDIDLDKVERLILVDVRHAARIGRFGGIIGRTGLDIHIYDHHPDAPGDIRGSVEFIEKCGSTTTVLVQILRERKVQLTPDEATILMAGIYEDTGFLSYPSTTTKDFDAASFLRGTGADLGRVADMLRTELTADEVAILDEFLHSRTGYTIGGVDIVVAEGTLEKSRGDISTLAHKIRDIGGMSCLFMLAESDDRVHVIARSRDPRLDVGKVLANLGGGGHPSAASATLKDVTLIEAKEKLLIAVKNSVTPVRTAEDIMSYPPITFQSGTRLQDAVTLMRRYNINAAPVLAGETLAGVITRQVADKAVYHGLGSSSVQDYMTAGCESVEYSAPVDDIREMVIAHGQRLIPVLRDAKVAGVITRTDLLKLLQEELRERPGEYGAAKRNLANVMKERLPDWLTDILKDAGQVAESLGVKAYAVGGFVRDLILRRENLDVDIVIEGGDGITFAHAFANKRGLRVREHHRFKTAVLVFPDGYKMDVATARLEYYERPGSLPTIEQSSLKLDLYRRDFIINTLAVSLNPGRFGALIDFFGAQKDIKDRVIRVLHNLSFVEDPTRALRAVRFSEKFGFRIEKHTVSLIKNAVRLDILKKISWSRFFDELKNILGEETAPDSVKRLHELGLLELIHGAISWNEERAEFFDRAHDALVWHRLLYTKDKAQGWLVMFLTLTDQLNEDELGALARKFSISGRKSLNVILSRGEGLKALGRLNSGLIVKNSDLYGLLKPLALEVIIYLMAKASKDEVKKALSAYLTKLKYAQTSLRGDDLKKMGVSEGVVMGELLGSLLSKRLDGEISSRAEEEGIVRERLKR